jgi:sugar O-acyltransferase (sialic acid O-acetyltransferase NeuD family)
MMTPIPILVPLLNANEPEARLIAIHVPDKKAVQKGDLLFTVETTKAAADVESPESGFFRLVVKQGETFSVGDVLAYLSASADEELPVLSQSAPAQAAPATADPGQGAGTLRMTKPARALAETLGIDLSSLPHDRLITESGLREWTGRAAVKPSGAAPNAGLIIYGAGGHAKAVMEMAQAIGAFRVVGIIDDNQSLAGSLVLGIPVLGTRELLPHLYQQGLRLAANGVGGIIDIAIRIKLFDLLSEAGFALPALRHPRATIENSARIMDGVQVFANAYVGSSVLLHDRCMINTGAIVSHDCEIGAYTHIAPGALLAGHVHVGERALVGMGVTTMIGIRIGAGARIGNGAILLADVPERAIVPAGKVWTA